LLVGGLTAALLILLVVGAVVVLNSGPGKKSSAGTDRPTASAKGTSGDPEIKRPNDDRGTAEPGEIADPPQAATSAAKEPAVARKASPLPAVNKWLLANRQKGGLRDVVRLGVGNAWLDTEDGEASVLNVEIEITNISPKGPLDFSGWRPGGQPEAKLRAVMADDKETLLKAAPPGATASRPKTPRRIAPGESETEQLSFLLPNRDSKQYRLALPLAALGQTGYLGFELPGEMIEDRSPGVAGPTIRQKAKGATRRRAEEPEANADLVGDVEFHKDTNIETMTESATEEPAPKEAEEGFDLRKQIEEDETWGDERKIELPPSKKPPGAEPKQP
jgi:hypothetical protein